MRNKRFTKPTGLRYIILPALICILLTVNKYSVRADEPDVETPAVTETAEGETGIATDEDLITFTKGRITYQVTGIDRQIYDIKIGRVKIIGNSLKSTVTGCSIEAYVWYRNNEYEVEAIDDAAFAFSKLEEIHIPFSVKRIGQAAFYGSSALKSVHMDGGVKEVGPGAFSYCDSLEDISIDAFGGRLRVYKGMLYTSDYETLLSAGSASGDITLKKNTKYIADYAFEGNSRITSVTMNKGLKTIGEKAFYDCGNLKSVSIPYSVSEIKGNPFEYCPNLTGLTVSAKNKSYKAVENMLMTKSGKTLIACPACAAEDAVLPETVKYIRDHAFTGNTSVESMVIPSRVRSIGAGAFADCTGLKSVKFEYCREGVIDAPADKNERVFGNTTHYLNVYLPYKYPSDEFMAILKENCPSGTIFIRSK